MKFQLSNLLKIVFLLLMIFAVKPVFAQTAPTQTVNGLAVTYFNNKDFTGTQLTRIDRNVNFNWGSGSPSLSIGPNTFSARWIGQVLPQFNGKYTFYTKSDDGIRLWINDKLIIDNWSDHALTENKATVNLIANQKVNIKIEYYENYGQAVAKLLWSSPSLIKQIIPSSQLFTLSSTTPTSPPDPTSTPTPTPNLTPTPIPTSTPAPLAANLINSFVTYYGWADNTPAGTDIAFPGTVHMAAGGIGTYNDPVTMASDPKVWPAGTKMYVPYIKKYVVTEDICGGCINNPVTGQYHIDIWMNSDSRNSTQLLACENTWTRSLTQVEINPPSSRLVNTTPLFDPSTGICLSSI